MNASITLNYTVKRTTKGTISLAFTTVAYAISPKVFAIEVLPKSADPENPNYRFSHVCSPAELVEFPEDEPGDNCYFRTDAVEFIFDTDKITGHVISNMKEDIARLVTEFNRLEDASGVTESVTF